MEMTQYPASTLRRWVKSFNERGIDGLVTHPCGGRPRKISQEAFTQQFSHILESPSDHGFDFMTVVRLHGHLTEELQHEISYSTVLRYVHDAGFALKVPGRKHPDANDADREVFLERLRKELDRDDTKVWFGDEAGIDGDPRTGRAWFQKGSKPTVPYDGTHLRQSIIGAVEPRTGAFEALAVPYTDSSVFQLFIDQLARRTKDNGTRTVLVIDNASWHHAGLLCWHHIEPLYLPAYSPDFNPIEKVWLVLKNRFFTNWYTRDPDKLLQRVCDALRSFIQEPLQIQSICRLTV